MKTGLFLALLVLLASTNVFAQNNRRGNRPSQTGTVQGENSEQNGGSIGIQSTSTLSDGLRGDESSTIITQLNNERQPTQGGSVVREETRPFTTVREESKPVTIIREETRPVTTIREETKPVTTVREETKNVKVLRKETVPVTVIHKEIKNVTVLREETVPVTTLHKETKNVTTLHAETKNVTTFHKEIIPGTTVREDGPVTNVQKETLPFNTVEKETNPGSFIQDAPGSITTVDEQTRPGTIEQNGMEQGDNNSERGSAARTNVIKPDVNVMDVDSKRPEGPRDEQELLTTVPPVINSGEDRRPIDANVALSNTVHVRGSIILVKHRSSVVDSVQYDIDGSRSMNGGLPVIQPRLPFAQDFLARHSRIILYVSTSKTTDPKLAFAQFPIRHQEDHFPISFKIDVDLPTQQRGLIDRADITLYFFVYIQNVDTRIDTFTPAGTSQILLQGTNRLVQKLNVYVRASGVEITGLFRSRFSQGFIRPGTSFQVLIVPEQSLSLLSTSSFESVGQLTINTVPAMFPVPFSLLVPNQMLKRNTKYFAIAYIYEHGMPRLLHQEPVYVINEQKLLVTPQVVFTVIPSPFILRGVVTRSMPGSFVLQPRSSLILRLHEIGSDSRDIIFKLPDLLTLPQVFQINISQALRFDPSKNYDMRALITDERNDIYMASLQPIPLLDPLSKLIVPVDDLLYYVHARLRSTSNQYLRYIPGSTAQIFVTESPEVPTQPIVARRIESITPDFRDFSIQVPATAIQRGLNYYLVMLIENNGIITHISKTLLISNNQPPPLVIQLPVLSLNVISGVLFDAENRPAQWSSSSTASLYLLDDRAENPDKAIVQVWKVHLENDFPVRFEVQLDFSLLRPEHVYRLQASIENGHNLLEYKPAGSVLALNPNNGILSDVRIPVRNVKTSQTVSGLVYINDFPGPFPKNSLIIIQLSSSPSLTNPNIVNEVRIPVDGRTLPIDFSMRLPLTKIDINSVYYFLVRYVVDDNTMIPSTQAFAFSPRNEATIVLTLSKTPQVPITGQVTSTGSPLLLPSGATLHLYITDNVDQNKPRIFSEVYLKATLNSLYEFTMNIDSLILQKQIPLYLRADILYENAIILSIPRPALLQITPGGEWNINLVVDLPTLLIGQIVSMSREESINGDFDVLIQIIERDTQNIVHTARLRLSATLPQKFRIEIDNDLFARYPALQAQAVIKNCKGQVLFNTAGTVDIHPGLNVQLELPVVLTDRKKLGELQSIISETAPVHTGIWRLSVTGVVTDNKVGLAAGADNNFALQK